VTFQPVVLEILRSPQSPKAFDDLADALDSLRSLPLSDGLARAARAAMRELAGRGGAQHRIAPLDYLVAAAAAEHGAAVLHYDRHFDRLAEVLAFESVWLAPSGSLP
jgi:predicted nucleic acid-binding protein